MKQYYKHHPEKVTVPFSVPLHEIGDYMSEDEYETLSAIVDRIGFTVTVENEPADADCSYPGGYRLEDWDICPVEKSAILFQGVILKAVDDYVWDHEEDILMNKKVSDAFNWFYSMRDDKRKSA